MKKYFENLHNNKFKHKLETHLVILAVCVFNQIFFFKKNYFIHNHIRYFADLFDHSRQELFLF